jgi:uncharacterized membrane protein SpoIIM required for sporulation
MTEAAGQTPDDGETTADSATPSDEQPPATVPAGQPGDSNSDRTERALELLQAGLLTHRYYAVAAVVVLLAGILGGWLLQSRGVALSTLPLPRTGSALYPQEQSPGAILGAETETVSLLVVGALTGGVLTVVGLLTQGLLVGSFLGASAGELGVGYLLVSVLAHGLLRALAYALAAAVSFRLVACALAWLFGRRERFQRPVEWRQAGAVLAFAWLCLAVSALIEGVVTVRLLDALF